MKYIIGLVIITGAVYVWGVQAVFAQNLNITTDTTIEVTSIGKFTLKSVSTANSMTVNSGNIVFDMSSGQTVTLQSSAGNNMTVSPSVSPTCVGTNSLTSQVLLSPSSDTTYTVTPSASILCAASVGGGSSGGSSSSACSGDYRTACGDRTESNSKRGYKDD